MIYAYTTDQIRAAEAVALRVRGESPLMAAASRAVATAALRRLAVVPSHGRRSHGGACLPHDDRLPIPGRAAVLLVGSGNNGGDALYAGAHMAGRGMRVTAVLTAKDRAHQGGLATLRRRGGRVITAGGAHLADLIASADVVIDGVVGLAARPPLRPPADMLIGYANTAAGLRIAVDLPSGIDPDTGRSDGPAFDADLTVTMGAVKTGLLIAPQTGAIIVAGLGMDPAKLPDPPGPDAIEFTESDLPGLVPEPGAGDDKFSAGVVGIVAGSDGYPGAAVLTVGGAVNTRPGLVRYAGPQAESVLARWPEAVATPEPRSAGQVQAWVVGPGMGTDGQAIGMLADVFAGDTAVLADADALTMLATHPDLLAARARRGAATLLTPHDREFARIFPDLDLASRLAAVRTAAGRSGATVLLKGDRTIVAAPDGRTAVNLTASPWLGTAGSGDVLSGVCGSLLAAGLDSFHAAAVGALLHGRAGRRAAADGAAGAQQLWSRLR